MTTFRDILTTHVLPGRTLLEHPFYRRWEAGDLVDGELTAYAEQYRLFEAMLPEFLAELTHRLPEGPARDSLEANLADEVASPTHLELFELFAQHYGARDVPASPAMTALLEAYRHVLDSSDDEAVAGLLAYEFQGAAVAETKLVGLAQHYGASSEASEFWRVHASAEVEHAAWTLDALAQMDGSLEAQERAATTVAAAWWRFLDEREALVAA